MSAPVKPITFAIGLTLVSNVLLANNNPIASDDRARHNGEVVIIDVLANDTEPDGEAMTVTLTSDTCDGVVTTDFGLVILQPQSPASEQCTIAYNVRDERGSTSAAQVTIESGGVIFKDGFESGDKNAWSEEETEP